MRDGVTRQSLTPGPNRAKRAHPRRNRTPWTGSPAPVTVWPGSRGPSSSLPSFSSTLAPLGSVMLTRNAGREHHAAPDQRPRLVPRLVTRMDCCRGVDGGALWRSICAPAG